MYFAVVSNSDGSILKTYQTDYRDSLEFLRTPTIEKSRIKPTSNSNILVRVRGSWIAWPVRLAVAIGPREPIAVSLLPIGLDIYGKGTVHILIPEIELEYAVVFFVLVGLSFPI